MGKHLICRVVVTHSDNMILLGKDVQCKWHDFVMLLIMCALVGCSPNHSKHPLSKASASAVIERSIPDSWRSVETPPEQSGVTKEYFAKCDAKTLCFVGPQSINSVWTDKNGVAHHASYSKECLYIWIIPANCHPEFPGITDIGAPVNLPVCIMTTDDIRVFGYTTNYVIDKQNLEFAKQNLTSIQTDSVVISWGNWIVTLKDKLLSY